MILSNEPGYYKTGGFGIRIENLVLVIEAPPVEGAEKPLHAFETLTLAPLDRRLIVRDLLSDEETTWVDDYHARVRAVLTPRVDADTAAWLEAVTRTLG
jgi:Xaa-Pro aminopeptidase